MIANIRTLTQSDSTELPDALCLTFLEQAWRHCAYWKKDWPFYRQTWTYTLVGDGTRNTVTAKQLVAGADNTAEVARPGSPNSIEQVFDTTNDRRLQYKEPADLRRMIYGSPTLSEPRYWTVEQGQWNNETITNVGWDVSFTLYVWPTPASGESYALRLEGWREPINFTTTEHGYSSGTVPGGYYSTTAAQAVPDMPPAFHEAILNYAIGQAFTFLDEGDRALFYITMCDNTLLQQEDIWFRAAPSDGPLVIGKGKTTRWGHGSDRLRYDFEG